MVHTDFLIIGGGVIGMLSALQLSEAGYAITLLERGQCGRQASWAGGGIVSPLYPWRQHEAISSLAIWSQSHYAAIAQQLFEQTGTDPEYSLHGLLYLDPEEADAACAWARQMDQQLMQVDRAFIRSRLPHLALNSRSGLWMPQLGSIRNPRLCKALRHRLTQLPRVTVHEHTRVKKLRRIADGRVVADTAPATFAGNHTILCGGAWSGNLLSDIGIDLPIHPVKGQMLLFKAPKTAAHRILGCVLLHNGRYLIPRADGRILAGSTLEPEAGFDQTITAKARASLHASAIAMLPPLADCEVEQQWAGLRPGAPNGLPFIGQIPGLDKLYINAGHYRNGLGLAPAATQLLVDQLLKRTPILDPQPFLPANTPSRAS